MALTLSNNERRTLRQVANVFDSGPGKMYLPYRDGDERWVKKLEEKGLITFKDYGFGHSGWEPTTAGRWVLNGQD